MEGLGNWFSGSMYAPGTEYAGMGGDPTALAEYLKNKFSGLAQTAMAPGQALQSTTPITTDEMIKPAGDLAMMMVGTPGGGGGFGSGIRTYHASPYNFDKFDLKKIGTGQGAQAYGHGLYFAENPAVAKQYYDEFTPTGWAADRSRNALQQHGGDWPAAVEDIVRMSYVPPKIQAEYRQQLLREGPPKANMYEVNLNASPEQFINWDKPLAEQPPQIGTALASTLDPKFGRGFYEKYAGQGADYKDLINNLDALDPAKLSQRLAKQNIPGIRYLDELSRSAGVGSRTMTGEMPTSNYVVFNPGIIDIMKKYALPLGVGAGALGANQQQQNQ